MNADVIRALLRAADYHCDADSAVWLPAGGVAAFAYSDGDTVEAALLQAVEAALDRSLFSLTLRDAIVDWPTRYHFSAQRANLLRPLSHWLPGRRVLEVGAGCGAISRYLGETGAEVLALEGSIARARIGAARTRDLPGVTVLAQPFQDLALPPASFDLVTLIGVLEYARIFFPSADGEDAVDAMLAHARRFLRPGGVLMIAIENQLGLKYFAGYAEDHVSEPMFGIEDRYRADGVVTFGRHELGRRVAAQGLAAQQWLFPFPDYKLPSAVLSERGVAPGGAVDLSALAAASVINDPQAPPKTGFMLERAWSPVFRNGLAGDLANSLLLLAAEEPQAELLGGDVLGWYYAVQRAPRFAKALCFRDGIRTAWVDAQPLCPELPPRTAMLRQHLGPALYQRGRPWSEALMEVCAEPGWTVTTVAAWAQLWLDEVLRVAELEDGTVDSLLPGHLLDAVPRNLMVDGEQRSFIDLEWELLEPVSLGYLCYRAIALSMPNVSGVAQPQRDDLLHALTLFREVMMELGLGDVSATIGQWHAAETAVQQAANEVADWLTLEEFQGCYLPLR